MKSVPYEFRGISKRTGEYVYGDLMTYYDEQCDKQYKIRSLVSYCPAKSVFKEEPVIYESVAQLIGYDSDRKEVYEDDVLIDERGYRVTAGEMVFQPQRIFKLMLRTEFSVERKDR